MGDKGQSRPKRAAKQSVDEGFWDCSVCTFRNSAEAFKCSICDIRKGTSTRKPRINSQLAAQQVSQQYTGPPTLKKEKKERAEREQEPESLETDKPEREEIIKPKSDIHNHSHVTSIESMNSKSKISYSQVSRPKLKNIDRSTAQQLSITVGNVTVIITDFQEKTRSCSSSTTRSQASYKHQQQSSGSDRSSSRASTPKTRLSESFD